MLVQTKSSRCPAEHCVFVYIGKTPPAAFGHRTACVPSARLRRFVPSHIHMELVMYKIDLASYAPAEGAYLRPTRVSRLVRRGERRTFACPIDNKCRNAVGNTESENRSVQILDLYPRLVSITLIDFDKKSEIFCPL